MVWVVCGQPAGMIAAIYLVLPLQFYFWLDHVQTDSIMEVEKTPRQGSNEGEEKELKELMPESEEVPALSIDPEKNVI